MASFQLLLHLAIFLLIVTYSRRCDPKNYRLDAGFLAFIIAGFNLAAIGHLILIQPDHVSWFNYIELGLSAVLLAIIMRVKGNTALLIDKFKSLFTS